MEHTSSYKIKKIIIHNKVNDFTELLDSGFNPNYEGGWPIRLAARHGYPSMVKKLIQFGADPHLLGESGASTLQLAVFSGEHWGTESWAFLLSCCDSSQLADGAAVAIIFQNVAALKNILETGRCNTNIPTTLTGKTVEDLAKGYKLAHMLNTSVIQNINNVSSSSPRRQNRSHVRTTLTPSQVHNRNLSPSVARFFHQTAGHPLLSPQRVNTPTITNSSPTTEFLNN